MSVTIPISIVLDFHTNAPIQKVYEVLADVPMPVGHFPNVESLEALGNDKYRWKMERMGTKSHYFQVQYTTRYTRSEEESMRFACRTAWLAVPFASTPLL